MTPFPLRISTRIILLFFIASFSAVCAEETLPAKLTLADAVSSALSVNPKLIQGESNLLDSQSRLRVAGLKTNYYVGGETSLEHTPADSGLSSLMRGNLTYENLLGTKATVSVAPLGLGGRRGSIGVNLIQPLLRGRGRLSTKANSLLDAENSLGVQTRQFYLQRQAKVLDVVRSYYRAVQARELVKVQEEDLKIAETEAFGAKRRAEEGLISGIDVSRAEISLAGAKDRLNTSTQSARAALDGLMLAIGVGVGQTPELIDAIPEVTSDLPAFSEALKTALANRMELEESDQNIANSERKLNVTKDQLRPELNLVAGFNSINDRDGFITGSLYDLGSLTTGFEIRLPLDTRIVREEQDIAARNIDILHKLKDFQIEQIAEQVRNSCRDLEAAKTSLGIYEKNLKLAEDSLNLAQRMVDEGLRDNRDLLEAQSSLTRFRTELLSARINLYLASINLKYAMGEDLTTMGSK